MPELPYTCPGPGVSWHPTVGLFFTSCLSDRMNICSCLCVWGWPVCLSASEFPRGPCGSLYFQGLPESVWVQAYMAVSREPTLAFSS